MRARVGVGLEGLICTGAGTLGSQPLNRGNVVLGNGHELCTQTGLVETVRGAHDCRQTKEMQ